MVNNRLSCFLLDFRQPRFTTLVFLRCFKIAFELAWRHLNIPRNIQWTRILSTRILSLSRHANIIFCHDRFGGKTICVSGTLWISFSLFSNYPQISKVHWLKRFDCLMNSSDSELPNYHFVPPKKFFLEFRFNECQGNQWESLKEVFFVKALPNIVWLDLV